MGKKIDFNQPNIYIVANGKRPEQRNRENNSIKGKRNSKIRFIEKPYNTVIRVRYIGDDGKAYKDLDVKDNKHSNNHKHVYDYKSKKTKRTLSNITMKEANVLRSIEKQNKRKISKGRIGNGKNRNF